MLGAGVLLDAALESVLKDTHGDLSARFSRARRLTAKGVALSQALLHSKCIHAADSAWLQSAEYAGRPELALKVISDRQVERVHFIRSLRVSLVFPMAVLAIGVGAGFFIKVLTGVSMVLAVWEVLLPALLLTASLFGFIALMNQDFRRVLSLVWSIPLVGTVLINRVSLIKRQYELAFFTPLLWQVKAGVPFDKAISSNQRLISNSSYQSQVLSCAESVRNGMAISAALTENGLVLSDRSKMALKIADASGDFERVLRSELVMHAEIVQQAFKNIVSWTPKVAYVLVLATMVSFFEPTAQRP